MLNRLKSEDEGFTLIELLVVILIIGILAAIALPSFLNQKDKGFDAQAKSDARNAVSLMESCYSDTQAYNNAACASATLINAASGLTEGAGAGQVQVGAAGIDTYTVAALSKGSGATLYKISKTATGLIRCKTAGAAVACAGASTW